MTEDGMLQKPSRVERQVGEQTLSMETGQLARQAGGAALLQFGDTVVLTAVVGEPGRKELDFFPLTVDYRERTYAAGKFPGGFIKREGRPTQKEILTMRLIDRPIRPLFPKVYRDEVQVQAQTLSADEAYDPDLLAMNGASTALMLSHIPFQGPLGTVRVGRVDGKIVINPSHQQLAESDLDLIVTGSEDAVVMIEGFAHEMSEGDIADAIMEGHRGLQPIIQMQFELMELAGVQRTELPADDGAADQLIETVRQKAGEELRRCEATEGKHARSEAVAELKQQIIAELAPEDGEVTSAAVAEAFYQVRKGVIRQMILDGRRPDGRTGDQLRPIACEGGVLPRTHGSAIFQRGETQALVVATLGTVRDEQRVDGLKEEYTKKFMLDYNFPPFSVGEIRPIRGPGRREIGHGALAERSLAAVFPGPDDFPYTVRLVSEILESNGSSSMASVCGGTLAMMDAGVPITDPVAGISIGMVKEGDRYLLLTDIQGEEDHYGDMDFKVAGTQNGVTGIQLDLKVSGITEAIIREALEQARIARMEILRSMLKAIPAPREALSDFAPRLLRLRINPDKIGLLIGPGGKNIKGIQETTGTNIDINDDGTVTISSTDGKAAEQARNMVEMTTAEVEVNRIYHGRVTSVKDFGAFVEILPGKDGLVHISELSDSYVQKVSDVCNVGDEMDVKVIAVDDQDRVKLSRRAAMREGSDGDSNDSSGS